MSPRQRIGVVTGGGGGIGGAIAEQMGRSGWFVVTIDPLVTLDGTDQIPTPQETTADRIVAAGGSAMASSASVTDRSALEELFVGLTSEQGPLDAVVNVAGITRQTGFAHGSADDWRAVLNVHLGGFLNILGAALPHMINQGHGSILGVTSGSGWRAANAGAYSCAKRAISALVWQLGRQTIPSNVTVNAISPIAATRMVAAAAERARKAGTAGQSGGFSLFDSMPQPEDLAPLGIRLVGDTLRWCSGRVIFAGGSEVAVVDEPRLLEVVRLDDSVSVVPVLEATVPGALASAEAHQASQGAANPRFGGLFDQPPKAMTSPTQIGSCVLVSNRHTLMGGIETALLARSIACHRIPITSGFEAAAEALRDVVEAHGPVDAIVLAPEGTASSPLPDGWQRTLEEHGGITRQIEDDAAWARAASEHATQTGRTVRLLTLVDAVTSGGRSRAQASAQLSRSAADATEGRVEAFTISLEDLDLRLTGTLGDVVAYLLGDPETTPLAGAELVLRAGWFGIRSHPRPIGSIIYGGPALPEWFDQAMEEILVGRERSRA